jgi:hypothetical protein
MKIPCDELLWVGQGIAWLMPYLLQRKGKEAMPMLVTKVFLCQALTILDRAGASEKNVFWTVFPFATQPFVHGK